MPRIASPGPPPWTPHPLSDIGSEGNEVEAFAVPPMPACTIESPSPSCPSGLPLLLGLPFGETWGLLRAGMFRGSRGLRVCGRSWVNGLSLDTCFTYIGVSCVFRVEDSVVGGEEIVTILHGRFERVLVYCGRGSVMTCRTPFC